MEWGGEDNSVLNFKGFRQSRGMAQLLKNLPAMQETRVQSLDWENPLEEGMEAHFCILARRIPWTEEPGGLQSQSQTRLSGQVREDGKDREADSLLGSESVQIKQSLLPREQIRDFSCPMGLGLRAVRKEVVRGQTW